MISGCELGIATGTTREGVVVAVHVDARQVPDPWALLRAFDCSLGDLEAAAECAPGSAD